MPTSRFLLDMTRGMTGVISRIKFPAVVDPISVSLVPRTAKSYSIWTVRNRPQQRHKQALRFSSAPPFTFLCIPLHGSSACHSLNPLQSTSRDAGSSQPIRKGYTMTTILRFLWLFGIWQKNLSRKNQAPPSSQQNRATFSSQQNQKQTKTTRAIRIQARAPMSCLSALA